MAPKKPEEELTNQATPSKDEVAEKQPETTKPYRVLHNVLGESTNVKHSPHRLYRSGSTIELGEKDANDLLKLKVIEPIR